MSEIKGNKKCNKRRFLIWTWLRADIEKASSNMGAESGKKKAAL